MTYAIGVIIALLLGQLTLVSYVDRLYSEIGKLKMQVDWLKKKLGE